jgi:hypothetical protein
MLVSSKNTVDEVDLREVFFNIVRLTEKYRWPIVVILLVGTFGGLYSYFSRDAVYKSSFTCIIPILKPEEVEQIINTVNQHVRDQNREALKTEYDFDTSTIDGLRGVKFTTPKDNSGNSSYTIEASVVLTSHLGKVQNSLINGILLQCRAILERERQYQQDLIKMLDREIQEIEVILKEENVHNSKFDNRDGSIGDLVTLKIKLLQDKLVAEYKIKDLDTIQIVQNFPKFKNPVTKNVKETLFVTFLLSLLAVCVYIFVFEARNMINERKRLQVREKITKTIENARTGKTTIAYQMEDAV